MTYDKHATAGLMLAALFLLLKNSLAGWTFWALYTLLAFLSHLALDAIPHKHFFILGRDSFQNNQKGFWIENVSGIFFIVVVLPLLLRKGLAYFLFCFWGIFCANLVDILALRFAFFQKVNTVCHWFEKDRFVKEKTRNGWTDYAVRLITVVWLFFFLF